jgi:hypothetical protein
METVGLQNIANVNDALKSATSWYPLYGVTH